MARLFTVLALIAVAAVFASATPLDADPSGPAAHHRVRRFSVEGIATCLALGGLPAIAETAQEIERDCIPLGNYTGLRYNACVIGKFAMLGPKYLECILKS